MKISLVLLDIIMPEKDGFEVLKYMEEERLISDIPVIIISSEDSANYIRRAYEMGVSDYINRPFDANIVYQRVSNSTSEIFIPYSSILCNASFPPSASMIS